MRDHILDLAHGNTRVAEAIRESLTVLKERGSDTMREMTRDALEGAPLRDMALSSVYGDELIAGFNGFWRKFQEMEPEERTKVEAAAQERFGELA